MEFRILGPLQALDDGRPVPLGGSKQRSLLALLLLHVNEPLSTERLIDELWGERPPAAATKALQVHVARLRKALGSGADGLVTRNSGYELRLAEQSLDACRFDRLAADGRAALEQGAPARAALAFEEALSLFCGEPLADLGHEPFARPHIDRLNDQRLAALEHLIEAELALGRAQAALERLGPLIDTYPYREAFRAQLMLALYGCDRQADALRAYRDARSKLHEDLGIEPGERLRALERAILDHDPALRSAALAPPTRPPAPQPPLRPLPQALRLPTAVSFAGREGELTRLSQLWATVGQRRRVVVLVSGEAGIGKTRLAAEFARGVHDARGLVLYGRCDEGLPVPYQPFADALRPAVKPLGADELRAHLGHLAGELGRLFPEIPVPGEPSRTDPESERLALFDAVLGLLEVVSRERRTLLVLDDLHWAPRSTLTLLRHLLLAPGALNTLFLLAHRETGLDADHPLARFAVDITGVTEAARITLGGLDEEEVATLVDAAPGLNRPPGGLAARLYVETAGNPLFVRELLAHLVESGAVDDPRRSRGSELEAPAQLRALIAQRIARLSRPARRVLNAGAVAGPTFSVGVIERAVGDEPDLLDAFDEATAAGLLTEEGHGEYAFAHPLVRHTVYRGLSSARRARLHRQIGEALEAVGDVESNLDMLAYHFAEAAADGQAAKAADYALAAGRAVTRRLGYAEAAEHYRRGLRALDVAGGKDDARRRELERALGGTVYQPLPDLGQLPLWLWRRLPRSVKVPVALTPMLALALAIVLGTRVERSKRDANVAAAQRVERARADYIARARSEQRPRSARGPAAGADVDGRRRLVRAARASVGADARARVARLELKGPILRVECEPFRPGGSTIAEDRGVSARVGRYECLAVTAVVPATVRTPTAALGHRYRVRIDFTTGRYVYCKVTNATGRGRSAQPYVPLPRACVSG